MKLLDLSKLNLSLAVGAFCIACVDAGGRDIVVPLRVSGSATDTFEGRDEWQLTISRASLALGPLTLCAGSQAGELCETARAEWLGSVVVNAASERSRPAGELIGSAGTVRSWMYDHAFVSLLTQTEPEELSAAEELGGYSLDLRFDARKGEQELSVVLQMALTRSAEVEQGVPLVQGSFDTAEYRDLDDGLVLELQFDPEGWLRHADMEELVAACSPACDGELRPDAETQLYRSVKLQLLAGQRPEFKWSRR